MPIWTEGAEEAKAVADKIKDERPKRFRIRQLVIKPGETVLLRFVSDYITRPLGDGSGATMAGWLGADVHGFIPTKPKPAEYTGANWPDKMWAVCQRDRMFRLRDPQDPSVLLDEYEPGYGTCFIHDKYAGVIEGPYKKDRGLPDAQVFALAVLREPVTGPGGAVIGLKDKTAEWTDPQGNVFTVPHFVLINQKYENFFSQVKAACFIEPLTVTNKDFKIDRVENKYTITVANQGPDLITGTPAWTAQYEAPLALMGFELRAFLLGHAEPDHYARWFIPGQTPKDGYARKDAPAAEADEGAAPAGVTPAGPAIDQAAMDAYRESMKAR